MKEIWVAPGSYPYYSPPAITSGGLVIVGHGNALTAYNLMDGRKRVWEYVDNNPLNAWYNGFYDASAVLAGTTPSYNLFSHRIIAVDDKGNKVYNFGTTLGDGGDASPLVTTKYVYAAFASGLYTLDLKLNPIDHIAFIPGAKTTVLSSPAIGPDGTIYMVDANGILEAFEEKKDR
jgi:outer membrane protein assembly factor BamB